MNTGRLETAVEPEGKFEYTKAKTWEIAAFAANNSATNVFLFLMMYVAYYASGIVGLGTVLVSNVIAGSRFFDGITDPIIGLLIDKTDGKFGKFRLFMIVGYSIMSISVLTMFFTTHLVPEAFSLIYWALLYVIYIIGYTFQTACTKSGQSALTNDPDQRPLFSLFDISYTSLLFSGAAVYVSNYLVPKHGGFTETLFYEFGITIIIFSGILTALAVAGIWSHDRTEFFGSGGQNKKIGFKEMFGILKGNRPLQMLVVAASTDKLGQSISGNSIVMVMLFGIIIGDYGMYGKMAMLTLIPSLIIVYFGTKLARKSGTKKAYAVATWLCIILFSGMFFLLWLGDASQISLSNFNLMTISFLALYIIGYGVRTVSGGLVIPMIPDVTDYETYKNDRYAPGVIGTLFSFVDKLISSLAQSVVGLAVAAIGFTEVFPDINTPYSDDIFMVTMFLFVGTLLAAWIASLIAMKFSELDDKRMVEIQEAIEKSRQSA